MWFFLFLSRLPFGLLYLLADVLFFVAYYIIGYRKTVVLDNLQKSFPEKSEKEIKQIQKKFYRHLANLIIEVLKTLGMSTEEMKKRAKMVNPELLANPLKEGKSIIVLTAHQGNWEWLLCSASFQLPALVLAVYKPLSNDFFDKLMKKVRARFKTTVVPMNSVLRKIVEHKKEAKILAMVADQSPAGDEKNYWTDFLHQDTAFFVGGEKIATRMEYAVYFAKMTKIKRGYYEISFEEIALPPFQDLEENTVIASYAQKLEKQIQAQPPTWLWSHKRWKHKRESS